MAEQSRTKRSLIVNADDFGLSAGVNRGIIEAHERGILTSASVMVRWPAAAEAADYGLGHAELSLGLHVDLGEWAYRDGAWVALYEVVNTNDKAGVAAEVERQLDTFRRLAGRAPTHLDSHQHVHRHDPVRSVLVRIADELQVPVRNVSPSIQYSGRFYGQTGKGHPYPEGISVENMLSILAELPGGVTELGCHPGDGTDPDLVYGAERAAEVRVLCDPRVRAVIVDAGIELCSFHRVARGRDAVIAHP